MTPLAEMLYARRVMSRLTMREAAREMGTSSATYCRIEQGHICDAETLIKIISWMMKEFHAKPTR
jgi:transcriptional regulator with XRE-family HTH domain